MTKHTRTLVATSKLAALEIISAESSYARPLCCLRTGNTYVSLTLYHSDLGASRAYVRSEELTGESITHLILIQNIAHIV